MIYEPLIVQRKKNLARKLGFLYPENWLASRDCYTARFRYKYERRLYRYMARHKEAGQLIGVEEYTAYRAYRARCITKGMAPRAKARREARLRS